MRPRLPLPLHLPLLGSWFLPLRPSLSLRLRPRLALAPGLALALAAAGCVTPTLTAPSSPFEAREAIAPVTWAPIAQEHEHADPALHNASYNVREIGESTAWGNGSEIRGGINELAVQYPYVYVSRSGAEGGFAILDVSVPESPEVVGEWIGEGGADIEVSADGNFVFFFTQRTVPDAPTVAGQGVLVEHAPRGIHVVDVSNKRAPVFESFFPLPTNGPHTGAYWKSPDGRDVLAAQTYDLTPSQAGPVANGVQANPATQRVLLLNFTVEGGVHVLEPISTFQVTDLPPPGETYFPHDSFIQIHPITGQTLMYVAYWDAGLRIVDITDLASPREIGAFRDFEPSALAQLHYAEAFPALIGGRHVTVVAPEIVTAEESGQMTFVDTTDPANPVKLGHFAVPGGLVVDSPFRFSPHNFDLDPWGRAYWGHYHAGVWVVDASDPTAPVAIGYHEPDVSVHEAAQMSVWGVQWDDGLMYASESSTGVRILRLERGALPVLAPGEIAPIERSGNESGHGSRAP